VEWKLEGKIFGAHEERGKKKKPLKESYLTSPELDFDQNMPNLLQVSVPNKKKESRKEFIPP